MAILVEGIDMPKNCDECPLNSTCVYSLYMPLYHTEKRHSDCPLIEVPEPHGRLGDLDAPISLIDTRGEKVEVTVAHIIEKNQGIVKAIIPESEKT